MTKLFQASATLYLLSVALGIWAAYDRESALVLSSWLIAGSVVALVLPSLRLRRSRIPFILCAAATAVAVSIGIYYLAQVTGSFGVGDDGTAKLYDNATAGALIILLPISVGSSLLLWSRNRRALSIVVLASLGVGLLALLFTASRGAFVGLATGLALTAYALWRTQRRPLQWSALFDASLILGLLIAMAVYAVVAFGGELDGWLGVAEWSGSPGSRIELWRDTLPLLQDYLFTGSGVGSTAMVYSTYAFGLHVPYYYHAHNLYLQLVLEQGVLGLAGFVGMAIAGGWMLWTVMQASGDEFKLVAATAFCALTSLLVHGLFDAELYVSPLVLVMFVPLMLATSLYSIVADRLVQRNGQAEEPFAVKRGVSASAMTAALVALVLFMVMVTPKGRAAVYANLGAVMQTRAELSVYEWPAWPNQEAVRQAYPERLEPAALWYERALALDPGVGSARRRLALVERSLYYRR